MSCFWRSEVRRSIRSLPRPYHFVGVGNELRRDDGVGIRVADSLRRALAGCAKTRAVVHGPSNFPESVISRIPENEGVVIFDAVDAQRKPGSIVCAALGETSYGFFATHNVPLGLIPGVAAREGVVVMGVVPASVEFGEGLSRAVKKAADELVAEIRDQVLRKR